MSQAEAQVLAEDAFRPLRKKIKAYKSLADSKANLTETK